MEHGGMQLIYTGQKKKWWKSKHLDLSLDQEIWANAMVILMAITGSMVYKSQE